MTRCGIEGASRAGIMISRLGFAFALAIPLISACTDSVEDELAGDDATAGDDAKADAAGGTYTYYFVKPDMRLCLSPVCGGVFYSLANGSSTTCLDGKKASQCYAADADWARLHLGDAALGKVTSTQNLLVRATIGSKAWPNGKTYAEVRPTEAWLPQGPNDAA